MLAVRTTNAGTSSLKKASSSKRGHPSSILSAVTTLCMFIADQTVTTIFPIKTLTNKHLCEWRLVSGEDGAIGSYHGSHGISAQIPVYSSGPILNVHIRTDYSVTSSGFIFNFTAVSKSCDVTNMNTALNSLRINEYYNYPKINTPKFQRNVF